MLFIICLGVRGLSKSIDFTGGRNYVVKLEKAVEPEEVREALAGAFGEANVSAIALGTDGKTIRVSTNYKIESNDPTVDDECENILFKAMSKANLVTQKDVNAFKNPDVRAGGSIISSTKVGPSVAKDITYGAIISVIFALIAIFIYILVRFHNVAYSVGSTVALALDTLIVIGFYSALWGIVPMSLTLSMCALIAVSRMLSLVCKSTLMSFGCMRWS